MENIKLCEVCGKKHGGAYGSGRFCSFSCKQKYSSKRAAAIGAKATKEKLGIKCKCEFCGKDFKSKLDLRKHLPKCEKKHNREWKCDLCDSIFKTRAQLYEHKKFVGHSFGKGTNQFSKAKILGLPIPESKCKGRPSPTKGRHLSDKQKRKMSETMKRKIAEGSFIAPYKRNHSSKVSYPEKYFMEVFKELPIRYNYQVGLYQLDFAIPEKMVYIEIDGEQHYVDKRIVEHDKERTEKLNTLGWNCLRRIRWSEYQKLSQNEKIDYCNELVNKLRSLL